MKGGKGTNFLPHCPLRALLRNAFDDGSVTAAATV
jgi:hypothetical protein